MIKEKTTIQKTLMTARLFEGFWDRWVAHGVILSEVIYMKNTLISLKDWEATFEELALKHEEAANSYKQEGLSDKAEDSYRLSSLYYNLIQWIFPYCNQEKIKWYQKSLDMVKKADHLMDIPCEYDSITVDGVECPGRIRIPENSKGCIVMVNPIDSTKEELYSYEKQFNESGYITVIFDGPGQGETFTFNGLRATRARWEIFINLVIEYAAKKFKGYSINLFGTSYGAAWTIYGSGNSNVNKTAVVSPPVEGEAFIPNFLEDKMDHFIEGESKEVLPVYPDLDNSSILVFHGKQDVLVRSEDMNRFFNSLPEPKNLIEYSDEGNGCNFKLTEIRDLSMKWYGGEK
ncbi:alpha/beta hydrolase [Ornithinibacillus sp. L9]|uniref:Alpha/beta hydrolase n=1 Tax=Ornithinibacillus caprae TaxID=2678566 RepID=A0A6N8FHW8_9BACI|nr:alpha/beta hydrolase [Ornithinibacillus caprae]MUK89045.1 alpha/beta hydrolase [Ornithinibacillus caprae]